MVFALAYAMGSYLGSWLESKLALGLCTIEVITKENTSNLLTVLRANNLGVTVIEGAGVEGTKKIFKIHLKRNRIASTVRLINRNIEDCVISVTDVKVLKGAYIR